MIREKPTPEDIRDINRYFREPFPEVFDDWTEEDFDRFRRLFEEYKAMITAVVDACRSAFEKMRPSIMAVGETCKAFLEAAGYRWDEGIGEWVLPSEGK